MTGPATVSRWSPTTPRGPSPSTSPTGCARPTSRTASRGRRWRCSCGPAGRCFPACAGRWPQPECRSRSPPTRHRSARSPRSSRCSPHCDCVVHRDSDGAAAGPDSPHHVDAATVNGLLVSPLVGLDATELRALARQARIREKALAAAADRTPRPSAELVRAAVLDPSLLEGLSGDAVRRAAEFARAAAAGPGRARGRRHGRGRALDAVGRDDLAPSAAIASGVGWPGGPAGPPRPRRRLRPLRGGRAGRRAARPAGVGEFLATLRAQQIPADTLAERGVRGDAVRLLTAHRAKGLEWDLVVVAHVQEEVWPDLRRRTSLLAPDRLGSDGLVPPVTTRALLTEERRLFYVACTRARRRLLVTAVASPDDDGEQPSRFLDELFPRGRVAGPARVGSPAPAAVAGRGGGRAAAYGLRPGAARRRSAGRRRAGWPGWRPSVSATARWCRRPTRPPGGEPARSPLASGRWSPPTGRFR